MTRSLQMARSSPAAEEPGQARINFGYRLFNAPVEAARWEPPAGPALFAVLVPDRLCHPRPFRPIYFGQIATAPEPGFLKSHRKYWEWRAVADSEKNLFVATFPMPFSSDAARAAAERELIRHYHPVCNA